MDIKPIETFYNGYRFRSRLEARWAVFFDAADIEYEYEPEGFELEDGTRYLPDFYLPEYEWYVEIKPKRDGAVSDLNRIKRFIGDQIKVLLILGNIPPKTDKDVYHYSAMYYNTLRENVIIERVCLTLGLTADQDPYTRLHFITWLWVDSRYSIQTICGEVFEAIHDRDMYRRFSPVEAYCDSFVHADDGGQQFINGCYDKARQARFEHGEKPSTDLKALADRLKNSGKKIGDGG